MVELEPHMFVNIHTELAKTLGIRDGDKVVIENDRGIVKAAAWVCEMVPRAEVWSPDGFDKYQPFYPYQNICEVIDDDIKDPFYTQCQYKSNLVRVYREGDDPDAAVARTKAYFASIGRSPKDYIDAKKDVSVNLGTYLRFVTKGSGIWYKAGAVPREKWETKD